MQDVKGLYDVFYMASEWLMKMAAVNLLWFLLSLPLFAVFLIVDMSHALGAVLFGALVLVFAPLLFFPATTAVFAEVRDWLLEQDSGSSVKGYLRHLKANYRESAKMGALLTGAWLVWYFGTFFFQAVNGALDLVFLLAGTGLFVYTVLFLSISVHYRMNRRERLANALFVTAGSPVLAGFIAVSSGSILWVSVAKIPVLLPLLACSLSAFLSFTAFHRFTLKVKGKTAGNVSGQEGAPSNETM